LALELHPLVAGFSDAQAYERGRPACGPEVVEVLSQTLGLGPRAPVLELGAGTGKLSRAVVNGGLDLTAVEPLESMRAVLAEAIGAARVRVGTAESIPLQDQSVDAVLAADAFHWFDESRAMPEIRRVLRPGGGVAILRSEPVMGAPWLAELGAIVMRDRPQHPAFGERGPAAALEEDDAFGPLRYDEVTSSAVIDREGILAWVASMSWIGTMELARRDRILAEVETVLEREGVDALSHRVLHRVWTARLRAA
jgi:SAM-dependent methyltransferase